MGTIIIIVILAAVVLFALQDSLKHFKGEGGCCGGGSVPKPRKKKLKGNKIAGKVIHIEGMHCENCKNAVERELNRIDGAAAKVNLQEHTAVVSLERMVSDEELKAAVEKADFKVTRIEVKEA